MKVFSHSRSVLVFTLVLLVVCSHSAPAQVKAPDEPRWVKMMKDPKANYYETIKSFRKFWKDRPLPKEPFESEELEVFEKEVGLVSDKESEEERERELKKYKNRKQGEYDYSAEVKSFKGWMQKVKPWVQADGSIIPEEEQQHIIDRQQAELEEIEKKNGKN